jgi:uracil-DNA glycosylase family 4
VARTAPAWPSCSRRRPAAPSAERGAGEPGASDSGAARLAEITARVVDCRRCPRLVAWREEAAAHPPRRYAGQHYWARPVPGFGDPAARVMVVGLAPAAHGGNRTGRIFTGDRSGDFLFEVLYRTGFANQPSSEHAADGLQLKRLYVNAINRCAPPANRPTTAERDNCLSYLAHEIAALTELRVLVCLGSFAWQGALLALAALGESVRPRPVFGHAARARVGRYLLLGSYHPSQQNVFTGRLTAPMLQQVMVEARDQAGEAIAARPPR